MIYRTHKLPLMQQCQILQMARSTAYYQPALPLPGKLVLMHHIDELHLNRPFAGARILSRMLKREGNPVGRRHYPR